MCQDKARRARAGKFHRREAGQGLVSAPQCESSSDPLNTEQPTQTRTLRRQLWARRTCGRSGSVAPAVNRQQRCRVVTGRAALQTLEAIAECGVPCQVTDRGNHGEFTRFFAVCIKNVIRHNAMRRPLYQQQQARRTKKRIWLGRGTSLSALMSEVVPVKLCWRGE